MLIRCIIETSRYLPFLAIKLRREWKWFNVDYHLLRGYSFSPKSICLILTEKCNLKCCMCDIGWRDAQSRFPASSPLVEAITGGKGVMEVKDWKRLVDDILRRNWAPLFLLTGTEPFLYPEVMQVVEHIVSRGRRVHITTNGTTLVNYARMLVDVCRRPDSVALTVSLDGIGELHDTIRGVKGTFERAVEGMKELGERKKEAKKRGPLVKITYTISNFNYLHMRKFVEWVYRSGLDVGSIIFSHLWFKDEAIVSKHNAIYGGIFPVRKTNSDGIDITSIDMEYVHDELRTICKLYAGAPFSIIPHPKLSRKEAVKYYKATTEVVYYNRCIAPWRNVSITPAGEVIISPMCFGYSLGNVKLKSFPRIWNDLPARTFRKRLRKVGIYPACVRCCLLFDSKPAFFRAIERL